MVRFLSPNTNQYPQRKSGMNKTNTLLGQLLEMVSRSRFNQLVKDSNTEKGEKGFTSWAHFVSMLFAQLSGQSGLRSIEDGINQQQSSLYHLGITRNVKRSTIAYANEKRTQRFMKVFYIHFLSGFPKDRAMAFVSRILYIA
jgi:hypothetical protein